MRQFANEFNQLCLEEKSLPLEQRHGTSMVLAVRQWQYSLFDQYQQK
jgi:hypothetical protein